MASFRYGLAKGLREPCSPYREAYYFGAELNKPSADGWNCLPELVSETHSFDLSTIPEGREVVVALLNVTNTPEGRLYFKAEWYRNRDNALLFTQPWSYTARAGGWVYFYAYLGRVSWEINENGGYRVELTVSGAASFSHVLQLTISGFPEEPVPPPPPPPLPPEPPPPPPEPPPPSPPVKTGAIGWISERFVAASGFFYQVYLETLDWVYPFWLISDFFYALAQTCADLSWDFSDFNEWVTAISDRILGILNWETIWSYIISYVPNLFEIRDWFYYWLDYVTQAIDNWWLSAQATVRGWIDAAKDWTFLWVEYLQGQIDELRVMIENIPGAVPGLSVLLEWFTNWPGHIISVVNTWWTGALTEVQGLINSAFIVRESLWAGWQDWRDKVTEFFTDPEDWLYKSADRIIERFW